MLPVVRLANFLFRWHGAHVHQRCTAVSPQKPLIALQQEGLHPLGCILDHLNAWMIHITLNHNENRGRYETCSAKLSISYFFFKWSWKLYTCNTSKIYNSCAIDYNTGVLRILHFQPVILLLCGAGGKMTGWKSRPRSMWSTPSVLVLSEGNI